MRRLFGMHVLRPRSQNRAKIEQLMLYAPQNRAQQSDARIGAGLFLTGNVRETDERVQLIHGAVRLDPQRIFGDTLTAGEAGFAFIAALGVDAIQRDSRIVESFIWWFFRHVAIVRLPGGRGSGNIWS